MAGMGAEGGFDADMMIHFPGFFRAPRAATGNLFLFAGALGGATAEPVTATGDATRPFACNGNTFTTFVDAATRSCNDQFNACAKVANSASGKTQGLTVAECTTQETSCTNAAANGPQTAAATTTTSQAVTTTAAPVQQTTTAVQVQPQTTTTQAAVVPVAATTQAAAPVVVASTPVVVASPSPTLHSSDEDFFYFCDP